MGLDIAVTDYLILEKTARFHELNNINPLIFGLSYLFSSKLLNDINQLNQEPTSSLIVFR